MLMNYSKRSLRLFSSICTPKDYYVILGLEIGAKQADVRQAYLSLAKQYHPDTPTGDAEKFKKIGEAYEKISDLNFSVGKEINHQQSQSKQNKDNDFYEAKSSYSHEDYRRHNEWAYKERIRPDYGFRGATTHGCAYNDPFLARRERYTYSQYKYDKYNNNHNWKNHGRKRREETYGGREEKEAENESKIWIYVAVFVGGIIFIQSFNSSPAYSSPPNLYRKSR
ncbi:unnamed protein product [Blepharisma stoltei]|uniref:J domain-containing protein n=1 Tax=Blepharisma stoltei TaxID=1481888 RepID=A0AAU9K0C5_9CILI|nr:unnamed protein product [Blepharisma stoltei]